MDTLSKIIVFILIVVSALWVNEKFFDGKLPFEEKKEYVQSELIQEEPELVQTNREEEKKETKKIAKAVKVKPTVTLYLLGTRSDGKTVFKKVHRDLPQDSSKLEFAVRELLKGPSLGEASQNIYSEIPKGTRLLSCKSSNGKTIINLSSDFQYGGGTDSIYSRIKQLLKTVIANSSGKQVYLHLDGKQVDIIGGEGIMLEQPLNEKSLY